MLINLRAVPPASVKVLPLFAACRRGAARAARCALSGRLTYQIKTEQDTGLVAGAQRRASCALMADDGAAAAAIPSQPEPSAALTIEAAQPADDIEPAASIAAVDMPVAKPAAAEVADGGPQPSPAAATATGTGGAAKPSVSATEDAADAAGADGAAPEEENAENGEALPLSKNQQKKRLKMQKCATAQHCSCCLWSRLAQ